MGERLGWLSPLGDFYETDWGKHGEEAECILQKIGLYASFSKQTVLNAGDYLSGRGYLLLHNPSRKKLMITHLCPLSDKQRDFLYGYFYDLGEKAEAEKYLA